MFFGFAAAPPLNQQQVPIHALPFVESQARHKRKSSKPTQRQFQPQSPVALLVSQPLPRGSEEHWNGHPHLAAVAHDGGLPFLGLEPLPASNQMRTKAR